MRAQDPSALPFTGLQEVPTEGRLHTKEMKEMGGEEAAPIALCFAELHQAGLLPCPGA